MRGRGGIRIIAAGLPLICSLYLSRDVLGGGLEQVAGTATRTVNPDAQALADFKQRVNDYAALHQKVEASLPRLSKEATPQEIDRHQRSLLSGLAAARASSKQGDIFTPSAQRVIKSLVARTFAQGDRRTLRQSIQDENPGPVKIAVNGRYPDGVPLANMPADLLRNLPELPPIVEYRFVGDAMILLDPAAHIIIDFIPGALPR